MNILLNFLLSFLIRKKERQAFKYEVQYFALAMGYLVKASDGVKKGRMNSCFDRQALNLLQIASTRFNQKDKSQQKTESLIMGKPSKETPLVGDALEEVSKGLMLASLSVTDNKGNTMKEVGKT